jgi:thiol:disulfide interchange protein
MKKFAFPLLFATAAALASFTAMAPKHSSKKPVQTPALAWFDFESGYEKAAKEGKILLVDAYTDWCGWCKVMDRNTYTNAQIIETLNANFVAVKFNPEKAKTFKFGGKTMSNDELLLWLGRGKSYGYPTSYFWTNPGKGESVLVSVGYEDPAKFAETLQTVLKRKGS